MDEPAGNAVKFTRAGGVCVSVERGEGHQLRFAVIDTGPGVPADRRAAIFEHFDQGDGSDSRRFEGAGLGLAISRGLVTLMGGALTLSDNPDVGSIFAFAISLRECADPKRAQARATQSARTGGSPRADRRQFAVRGACHRCAPDPRRRGTSSGRKGSRPGSPPQRPAAARPRIVDCALGPEATIRLAQAARAAGAPHSLVLFSPFERRAFGQTSLAGFDGWLVKPVRARSLFERLAAETFRNPSKMRRGSSRRRPERDERSSPKTMTSTRLSPRRPCAVWVSKSFGRRTAKRRCGSLRRPRRLRSTSS